MSNVFNVTARRPWELYDPDAIDALRAENAALREALLSQIAWWEQVPSGVDYDADPANESPHDAVAHIAGLAIREAREVLQNQQGLPSSPLHHE